MVMKTTSLLGLSSSILRIRANSAACSSSLRSFSYKLERSDDEKRHEVSDHHVDKTPITSQLWMMRKVDKDSVIETNTQGKEATAHAGAAVEGQILAKKAADSRLYIKYNFSTDHKLRDLYVDSQGNMQFGMFSLSFQ